MNFTASYMQNFKLKVFDNLGNPIETVFYEKSDYDRFKKPILVRDILVKKEVSREPIIKKIMHLDELENLGFVVCTVPVDKNTAWTRMQRTMFVLFRKNSIESQNYKKIRNRLDKGGSGCHTVEFDEANLIVRLVGPKAGPTGVGPWQKLD